MKLILGIFLMAAPVLASYTYYYSDPLTTVNAAKWVST